MTEEYEVRRTFEKNVPVSAPVGAFLLFVSHPLPLCYTIQPKYANAQKDDDDRYAGDVVCEPNRTIVPWKVLDIMGSGSVGGLM